MTNDNPTLIAGFEDVMTHIRNQEKRIQELEKENEKLQEYQSISNDYAPNEDKYMNGYGDYIGNPETLESYIHKITTENYSLKNKIREMTPEHNEIKEIYADRDKVKEENEKVKQEIRDVRKENEELSEQNKKLNEVNIQCRKEIEAISAAVENECEASGIMEVMNMRIEDAEKQVEEYKLKYEKQSEKMQETRKRANDQIQRLITRATVIKNLIQTIIANDENGNLYDEGIKLRMDWNLYGTGDTYHDILEEEIDEMNHDDWNEDENRTKIIYEDGRIRTELIDTSSEEETDEDA